MSSAKHNMAATAAANRAIVRANSTGTVKPHQHWGHITVEADSNSNSTSFYLTRMENEGYVLNCAGRCWYAKDLDELKEVLVLAMVATKINRSAGT